MQNKPLVHYVLCLLRSEAEIDSLGHACGQRIVESDNSIRGGAGMARWVRFPKTASYVG